MQNDKVNLIDIYNQDKVYCPICEKVSDTFSPFRNRENAMCPYCKSLERHRGEMLWMLNDDDFFYTKKKLLHIAPERQFSKIFKYIKLFEYVSGDIQPKRADVELDITKMYFSDETFDFIICNHVLEHIEKDFLAIKELYRVLKNEGKAIISFPIYGDKTFEDPSIISEEEREIVFKQKDHVRLCGKDYIQRIENAGFKTHFCNYEEYSLKWKKTLGLSSDDPNGVFYLCIK